MATARHGSPRVSGMRVTIGMMRLRRRFSWEALGSRLDLSPLNRITLSGWSGSRLPDFPWLAPCYLTCLPSAPSRQAAFLDRVEQCSLQPLVLPSHVLLPYNESTWRAHNDRSTPVPTFLRLSARIAAAVLAAAQSTTSRSAGHAATSLHRPSACRDRENGTWGAPPPRPRSAPLFRIGYPSSPAPASHDSEVRGLPMLCGRSFIRNSRAAAVGVIRSSYGLSSLQRLEADL